MKYVVRGSCLLAAAAVLLSVPGIAAADGDPYVGMTYGTMSESLATNKAAKVVVSTVVGGLVQRDDCLVTHTTKTTVVDGTGAKSPLVTFLVDLNCNDPVASAGVPGNSAVSPEGSKQKGIQTTLDMIERPP